MPRGSWSITLLYTPEFFWVLELRGGIVIIVIIVNHLIAARIVLSMELVMLW